MWQCQVFGSLLDTGKGERKLRFSWHVKVENFTLGLGCLQHLVILTTSTSLPHPLHPLHPLPLIHCPAKESPLPSYAAKCVCEKKLSQMLLKKIALVNKS